LLHDVLAWAGRTGQLGSSDAIRLAALEPKRILRTLRLEPRQVRRAAVLAHCGKHGRTQGTARNGRNGEQLARERRAAGHVALRGRIREILQECEDTAGEERRAARATFSGDDDWPHVAFGSQLFGTSVGLAPPLQRLFERRLATLQRATLGVLLEDAHIVQA